MSTCSTRSTYDGADLVIAGDGTRRASCVAEVADPARPLPRARSSAELAALYAGAIALIVPSVGYEVFPLVRLEAFAQRTPVIARRLGGLPEAVEESGGGFTYHTKEELVDGMERLRLDPALRAELGARGRAAWRERWSEDPHIASYLAAIREAQELSGR